MPVALYVIVSVILSYIITCLRDFKPFWKELENLPEAIITAWPAAAISLISRTIFIISIMRLIQFFDRDFNMVVGAVVSAFLITEPPHMISQYIRLR